jgi:hypothetical protein
MVASAAGTVRTAAVEVGAQAAVPTAAVEVEVEALVAAALTGAEVPVRAAAALLAVVVAGAAITKGSCNACLYPHDASIINCCAGLSKRRSSAKGPLDMAC